MTFRRMETGWQVNRKNTKNSNSLKLPLLLCTIIQSPSGSQYDDQAKHRYYQFFRNNHSKKKKKTPSKKYNKGYQPLQEIQQSQEWEENERVKPLTT